jgi:hypothetical protein
MGQPATAEPFDPVRETLLFLHVPKAAGISLSQMIRRRYSRREIFHIRWRRWSPVFSSYRGTPAEFCALPEWDRARFRLVLGHFNFRLHEHIPGAASYVTVLRNPIERFLSQFAHANVLRRLQDANAKPLSLEEFCQSPERTDNLQARMLCGEDNTAVTPELLLARAQENLQRWFRVVGTVERMDETVIALERTLGWPRLPDIHENASASRPRTREIGSKALAMVEEVNRLDLELYRFADAMLTARIEALGHEECQRLVAERRADRQRHAGRLRTAQVLHAAYRRLVPYSVRHLIHATRLGLNWR